MGRRLWLFRDFCSNLYLAEFRSWLRRIGYKPLSSGIVNADCPNLLIQHRLRALIEKAYKADKRKVHVIGHSLAGCWRARWPLRWPPWSRR